MFHQTALKSVTLVILLLGLGAYVQTGGYYGRELVIEACILAMLALSVDVVAGYGGMISMCHGALLGAAAYAFAAMTALLGWPPSLSFVIAIVASTLLATAIGAVSSRTQGIFFIMATLAFGQMVYVMIFDAPMLGGDDGMAGVKRLNLDLVGINFKKSAPFAFACIALLALSYGLAALMLRSGFGRTLSGVKANEDRLRALGVRVWWVKARAFGFSGLLAGIAGVMAAQHTQFVSPELLLWTLSGEALVVVILGGLGTLVGPLVGAIALVFVKHEISSVTHYWHLFIGIALILTVLAGGRGLYGQFEYVVTRARRRRAKDHA